MKRRGVGKLMGCAVMLVASVAGVRPAEAATTECIGELPTGITVPGPLTVPDTEHCFLREATVMGNVTVFGSLFMDASKVAGSVTGDAAQMGVYRSRISKGLSTTEPRTKFFIGPAFVLCDTNVVGNVTVTKASAPPNFSSIAGPLCPDGAINKVAGSVHLLNNALEHDFFVWNTQISGDLVCQASANPDLLNVTVVGTIQNDCD